MKRSAINVLFLFMFTILAACAASTATEPDSRGPSLATVAQASTADAPSTFPLNINTGAVVGDADVWNDEVNVYVLFDMASGYLNTAGSVCASRYDFPLTPPHLCDYVEEVPGGTDQQLFTIPLAALEAGCGDYLYLQLHALTLDTVADTSVGCGFAGGYACHVGYVITCDEPEGEGCTLTQGYWKTHPASWPVGSLTIGGVSYTKAQLITLLKTAPRGDASLILGHQLIATLLNAATGAELDPVVEQALAEADDWMFNNKDADGRLPYKVMAPKTGFEASPAYDEAINLKSVLDTFNNGDFGTPHCEDGPPQIAL